MLDRIFFGNTGQGLVFYRFGRRSRPYPVTMQQVEKLRTATMVAAVLSAIFLLGGVSFFAAMSFVIAISPQPLNAVLGFDPRLLFLAEIPQAGLIAAVLVIYDLRVGRLLRA